MYSTHHSHCVYILALTNVYKSTYINECFMISYYHYCNIMKQILFYSGHEVLLHNTYLHMYVPARPQLYPVPVKSPWYYLGIDIIGPYSSPSSNGNKYVLTVCDYFSKFVWTKPLPSKEAKNVTQALREFLLLLTST